MGAAVNPVEGTVFLSFLQDTATNSTKKYGTNSKCFEG